MKSDQPSSDEQTPQSEDCERCLIASIIKNPLVVDMAGGISENIFFHPKYRTILTHVLAVFRKTGACGWEALKGSFRKIELEAIGGLESLSALFVEVPSSSNWEFCLKIVLDRYRRRLTIKYCKEVIEQARDTYVDVDPAGLLERSANRVRTCADDFPEIDWSAEASAEIKKYLAGKVERKFYEPSSLRSLNLAIGGFFPGNLVVVAGEVSHGKSALALDFAGHMALDDQHLKIALFSFEMPRDEINQRLIASRARVRLTGLRFGQLNDLDRSRLATFAEHVPNGRTIIIEDSFHLSIEGVEARCRKLKASGPLDVAVIDYLQLIPVTTRGANREREVAEISRRLKALAGDLQIVVIAVSQLNDEGKLRESRAIGQDADFILIIKQIGEGSRERQILIDKSRNGNRGQKIMVDFFPEYVSFSNKS